MIDWEKYDRHKWRPTYGKLYLVASLGYPIRVCNWITGSAFVDIATGRNLTYDIQYVAECNLPEQDGEGK